MDAMLQRIRGAALATESARKALHAQLCEGSGSVQHYLSSESGADGAPAASRESALLSSILSLDAGLHTLGIVHLLAALDAPLSAESAAPFFDFVSAFALRADAAQLRVCPEQLKKAMNTYTAVAIESKREVEALHPINAIIRVLEPGRGLLTPLHAMLLKLSLLAQCPHVGLRLLRERPVVDLPPQSESAITAEDYLSFCYYAGSLLANVRRFKDAAEHLLLCVSMPWGSATTLSKIQLCALKKLMLCTVLSDGRPPTLPKFVSAAMQRHAPDFCKEYRSICDAFSAENGTASALHALLGTVADKLREDGNLGLAQQCVAALKRRRLVALSRTYITVPMARAAQESELGGEEAEKAVVRLVEDGLLDARINQRDGLLSFDGGAGSCGAMPLQRLEGTLAAVVKLSKRITGLEDTIATDPRYLQRAQQTLKATAGMSPWAMESAPDEFMG